MVDRGVVQSVSPTALTLLSGDGTMVSVPVDEATHVFVGDRPAGLTDIQPGFLVASVRFGNDPAQEVRAVPRRQR